MTSRARHAALIAVVAVAGLAVAVALALLTSHLTTQHVGLAGEPSRPATGLVAPVSTPRPAKKRPQTVTVAPAPTTTAPTHHSENEHEDD